MLRSTMKVTTRFGWSCLRALFASSPRVNRSACLRSVNPSSDVRRMPEAALSIILSVFMLVSALSMPSRGGGDDARFVLWPRRSSFYLHQGNRVAVNYVPPRRDRLGPYHFQTFISLYNVFRSTQWRAATFIGNSEHSFLR